MNAYFFKMNKEEKNNILDQHKQLYDGYVTRYNQESNEVPLYTQDFANDKGGITVNNKGEVKPYTNMGINESMLDTIGDGSNDLENGTVDLDSTSNHEMMHDTYPSPNEDEDEYVSLGNFDVDMTQNLDQYEYDIDELEDYSTDELYEMYHETDPEDYSTDQINDDDQDPEFENNGDDEFPEFENNGEEEEIFGTVPDFDWLRTNQSVDEDEDMSNVISSINESLDMFRRFNKYN